MTAGARAWVAFDPAETPLDRASLVEASAGTGKTYSITLLYLRCLLEKKLDPRNILVVTFTRAATAELRHRIREGIRGARAYLDGEAQAAPAFAKILDRHQGDARAAAVRRLEVALDGLDRASIFTIDGFFKRIISQHAFEAGLAFDATMITDTEPLLDEIGGDLFVSRFAHASLDDLHTSVVRDLGSVAPLVRAGVDHGGLPILPAATSEAEVKAAGEAFRDACAAYRRARERSGDLEAVVAQARHRKSPPGVATIEALVAFLDRVAKTELAPTKLPSNVGYLRKSAQGEKGMKDGFVDLPLFTAVDELAEAVDTLRPISTARDVRGMIENASRTYRERTMERGVLTFGAVKSTLDALLADAARGAALSASLAATYEIALVDECQDTDEAQLGVFETVFRKSGRPLLLIGDPKQAIYRFRGADVHAYLGARGAADALFTMEKNFRSRPELVRTLDALYRGASAPFGSVDIEYPKVEPGKDGLPHLVDPGACAALEVLFSAKSGGIRACGADIRRTLESARFESTDGTSRRVRPKDIAVLTRSNSQVANVCRQLRALGIPAVASSNASVLATPEAAYVIRWLGAVLEPGNARKVRAALLTPLFRHTPRSLARLRDEAEWDAVVERLLDLRASLRRHGPSSAFAVFARQEGLEARLLRRPDGFRVVTNLAHVIELATRAAAERRLGAEGVLAWLERARAGERDESGTEERALRLEHSGDAVQVLTVHKSKGLEYGITYVVGIAKKPPRKPEPPMALHLPGRGRVLVTDFDAVAASRDCAEREAYEEDARLAYVAMTRAIHSLRVIVELQAEKNSTAGLGATALGKVLGGEIPVDAKGGSLDGPGLVAHVAGHFVKLAADTSLSLGVRELKDESSTPYTRSEEVAELVAPSALLRTFTDASRTSSFSGLVADAEHARPDDRDRSATDPGAETGFADPLAELAAGSKLGIALHDILETIDFDADEAAITRHVEARTKKADAFTEAVLPLATVVRRTLATPLLAAGPRLADVPRKRTMRELEFHLSVGTYGAFDARSLGRLFSDHGVPKGAPDYGDSVARLGFASLRGFLHGFVDLVFEHDGKFHVVDYKSNRLGGEASYAADALVAPMTQNHYVLQYALYTVALHRFLRRKKPGYDYDAHMGGALYLFLRGMDERRGASSGVFADRLPRAFVEALDDLLDGRSA